MIPDMRNILQILEGVAKNIQVLTDRQKTLELKVETIELKVETIRLFQQKAFEQSQKDHTEIMEHMLKIADITGEEHKALETRVERIEKHLNLSPMK